MIFTSSWSSVGSKIKYSDFKWFGSCLSESFLLKYLNRINIVHGPQKFQIIIFNLFLLQHLFVHVVCSLVTTINIRRNIFFGIAEVYWQIVGFLCGQIHVELSLFFMWVHIIYEFYFRSFDQKIVWNKWERVVWKTYLICFEYCLD